MSTHNICFRGVIRKISAFSNEKSALSAAMRDMRTLKIKISQPSTQSDKMMV